MSAEDVIRKAMEDAFEYGPRGADPHDILSALGAARYGVVEIPSVDFKGPNDTDASMFRRAAQNLEDGFHIGGGNLQRAIIQLLRSAADAAEAQS